MSFLNSVLSSIETGDVPPPPPAQKSTAPSSSASPNTITNAAPSKATLKPPEPARNEKRTSSTPKRKADSSVDGADRPGKVARPSPLHAASRKGTTSSSVNRPTAAAAPRPKPAVDSKPAPKGSYADMMAQAKALQSKVPTNLGTIKHQTTPKDRRSKVQQKRLDKAAKQGQEPSKATGNSNGGRRTLSGPGAAAAKSGDADLRSPKKPAEPDYKGTARQPKEPTGPSYKGTAGLRSRHESSKARSHRPPSRPSRMDEYLGTDEEDEGDYEGEGGYFSDESTDMEAGIMDMESEEQAALRIAKEEDEKELRMEMEAKKEKLARKKKLQQLSSKTRP